MMHLLQGEEVLNISGPVGNLQAAMLSTQADKASVKAIAVVCHPHPLEGGSMTNKVVTTLIQAFQRRNVDTLRFNFRGVGDSEGHFDKGVGEVDDLLAAIAVAEELRPGAPLILAGFSFGSYVAACGAARSSAVAWLGVAPPVNHYDFSQVPPAHVRRYVFQGDSDEVVSLEEVQAWVASQSAPPELMSFDDTGHFFHRRLLKLREAVEGALAWV